MLTENEKLELRYLRRANKPLWGGHLKRKEPITDPKMQRWLDLGLIKAVQNNGYVLTETGIEFLNQ